jgi:hypothetical protein
MKSHKAGVRIAVKVQQAILGLPCAPKAITLTPSSKTFAGKNVELILACGGFAASLVFAIVVCARVVITAIKPFDGHEITLHRLLHVIIVTDANTVCDQNDRCRENRA